MMKITFLMMIFSSILILMMTHPLSISIILFLQVLLTSLMMTFFMKFSWFSYIIFLIMIGGLFIIFIYMTSVASNEYFNINKFKIYMMIFFFINMMFFFNIYFFEMNEIYNLNLMFMKYFNYPLNNMIIFMFIYMFITLIACVKISNTKYGPMRQKF